MKLQELLKWGNDELKDVQDADGDARWLLLSAFDMSDSDYLLQKTEEADAEKQKLYVSFIERRKENEPVAYILGKWEFMGLDFEVNRNVLIPRQDTETLVESALEEALVHLTEGDLKDDFRILDLCTGSGCIAISVGYYLKENMTLALSGVKPEIWASDISQDALKTAEKNADISGVKINFRQGDLFDAFLDETEKPLFDMILSNPPYIDGPQMKTLPVCVRDYEPDLALSGGDDGLVFYRRLSEQAGEYLKPGGVLFWEIGEEQAEAVSQLIDRQPDLRMEEVIQDLAGHDRVIRASRNN